jgi:hypothetical protein
MTLEPCTERDSSQHGFIGGIWVWAMTHNTWAPCHDGSMISRGDLVARCAVADYAVPLPEGGSRITGTHSKQPRRFTVNNVKKSKLGLVK